MEVEKAAKRIVEINHALDKPLRGKTNEREILMSEQRQLWDAYFPGRGYEAIERITQH